MRNLHWFLFVISIVVAGAIVFWYFANAEKSELEHDLVLAQQHTNTNPHKHLANAVASSMLTNTGPQQSEQAIVTLANQIEDIATAYSQSAKYPRGSQPIFNPEQVVTFSPFEENATSFPFNSNLHGQVQLSVATEKYQHFSDDDVSVLVTIGKVPSTSSVGATATLSDIAGDELLSLNLEANFAQSWQLTGIMGASTLANLDLPPELQVSAIVDIDGESYFSSTTIKYNQPSATIKGLGNANPNAEYLDLPLKLDVHNAGYYFLNAVLFDAAGKVPLVQLQGEARLREGDQELLLKAHVQALKVSANEGPYVLKNFLLTRGADNGEVLDSAGNSKVDELKVEAFSFDRYEDKPYENPLAQERVAFLRNLSKANGK